ncbi:MAG: hypothetical protein Q9N68_05035 [Gammaproteobacteria bacterium]|nr:hypothetical protein [Gammaproteobacteria bacterium]
MNIKKKATTSLQNSLILEPSQPLWKRAPKRDKNGVSLFDFILHIPKLNKKPLKQQQETVLQIEKIFDLYQDKIVFADLNLKINVLWVSIKPIPGLSYEIAAAIKIRVPEAIMVANQYEANRKR